MQWGAHVKLSVGCSKQVRELGDVRTQSSIQTGLFMNLFSSSVANICLLSFMVHIRCLWLLMKFKHCLSRFSTWVSQPTWFRLVPVVYPIHQGMD